MKRSCPSILLCALTLLLLNLTGCGGGSSSPESSPTVLLRGVVEDGPIENARISLRDSTDTILDRCGPQGNARCENLTDAGGTFSLEVASGLDLAALSVVAVGGIDRSTGVDFTGLEMRTPLALFAHDATTIVTSPLTTLVAEFQTQGLSLDLAQNRVRDWLALPLATNLAGQPSASLDLQRRTLLLTKIAYEISEVAPTDKPFVVIAQRAAVTLSFMAVDGPNIEIMKALGLDASAQKRIIDLQTLLAMAPTAEEAVRSFKRKEWMNLFAADIKQMLIDSAAFDPENVNFQNNLQILAEKTLLAAGSEVIPLRGTIPQRIARYILFTYQLRTLESLTADPMVFSEKLVPLENDPWIAELARSRSLYSVVSPLTLTELPGNDNQQRLMYFYDSDLSPHYQAEKLIGQVYDDAINDAILLKIVEGKANAGLIDETRAIIATQIVQSESKAHAYRTLGKALISFGRMSEARIDLLSARDLYFNVIEAKGKASASNTDTINLHETAALFRKAGYLDDAGTVLQYLAEVAQALVGNAGAYGRLLVGTWNVADTYIAAGDLQAATPVVDSLYGYAQMVPASLTGTIMTYKQRVFSLVETSKRYADLGNRDKVLEIFGQIQALRSSDGFSNLTGAESWAYIPGLVEALYRVDKIGEALALAETIPASFLNALGKTISGVAFQTSAFKLVATYEALNGSLDNAFAIVERYFPKPEDKVDVLTYFASNKGVAYIGMSLINAGRIDDAHIALTQAQAFLAVMTEATDANRYTYLIQRGYVKVADLYAMTGDTNKAAELLQQAQGVVAQLVGVKEIVNGLVDIALGYQQIGQTEVALSLLQEADNQASVITTAIATPEDAALLYEALGKAYLQLDDKALAHGAINTLVQWSRAIHTPGGSYTGTANDDLAGKEVDALLRAAQYLVSTGYRDEALSALDEARSTADLIKVEATRLAKYIFPDPLGNPTRKHLIGGYANARAYDQALALAIGLKYTTNRNQAIAYLADIYIRRDDFPDTSVASIDSDDDGQPDFFHPLASAEEIATSGLHLDDDSDGDGIADTLDLRPLFAD